MTKNSKNGSPSQFGKQSSGSYGRVEELEETIKKLESRLREREEELARVQAECETERERSRILEQEVIEKELIISQLSMQQTLSPNNDTMFGKESLPRISPSTALKGL